MPKPNRMRKLISILLFLLLAMGLYAQQNWLMRAGSGGNDEALSISTDAQGNIYTTGYFTQPALFGTLGLQPAGVGDVFVAKQNAAGVYQWAVRAGGVQSDRGVGICTDAQGNSYITGFYSGTALFGNISLSSVSGSQDIFIAKLDAAGAFVWAVSYGGSDIDLPSGIAVDAQGNVIVTGQFKGTATIGTNQFTSDNDPDTNDPTYDIFILKLNNAGSPQWAKHGKAKREDRGLQAAVDASGNIYVTGQFSDTLRFTNTYNNVAYNVGYLMKLSPDGTEQWFRRLQASLTAITGLVCKANSLFLTGDFLGQLVLTGPPNQTLTSAYAKKLFLARYDLNGSPQWVQADGSANALASKAIAVDNNGNSYITGTFRCTLTEYAEGYGVATFNSVGFRDIFVAKYSPSGQRVWERQLGGTGDDLAAAIVVNTDDKPIICGSFEKNFSTPSSPSSFVTYPQNIVLWPLGPNAGIGYCSDGSYGQFVSIAAEGNKDVLSMMAVDLSRQPYDYYDRIGNSCVRDTLMPYINQGQDTIKSCGMAQLYPHLRTGIDGAIGPEYEYLWSNGSTNDTIEVNTSGQYILNYNFKDDCRSFSDTIYVVIYPNPPQFQITSSYGQIFNAKPAGDCLHKLLVLVGDTATISGIAPPQGLISYWTTPGGQIINGQQSINVWEGGVYTYTITTPDGYCQQTNCIELIPFDYSNGNCIPLNFDPYIFFPTHMGTDTIRLCPGDTFTAVMADSNLYVNGIPHTINAIGHWGSSNNVALDNPPFGSPYTISYHVNSFVALQSGPAFIKVDLLAPPNMNLPFRTVIRNFYLDLYPEPPNNTQLSGLVTNRCPGDTTQIFVSGGDEYIFVGPQIAAVAPDSSWFKTTKEGDYYVYSIVQDPIHGCINRDTAMIHVSYKPAPLVAMNPASGLICPNDSVMLTAQSGGIYYWVGPLGDTISVSQTAYATSPGNYYYVMIDGDDCAQVSEFVEVREYSTPFLSADPGNVLCPGGSVSLQVDVDDGVQVSWQPPLSGSSLNQNITQPGEYGVAVTFCGITTVLTIQVQMTDIDAEISVLGDSILCAAQPITLVANQGPYEYEWMPVNEFAPQLLVEEEGTYILKVTDENGCSAYDTMSFVMLPSPLPPTSVIGDTVCAGDSATVIAIGNGTIAWYLSDNTPYIATGSPYITAPFTGQELYYAAIVDTTTGCRSLLIPVDLALKPGPQAPVLVVDTTICLGAILSIPVDSLPPNTSFVWYGPGGINGSSDNPLVIPVFTNQNAGSYQLIVSSTDSTQCGSDTASINITAANMPNIALSADSLQQCVGSVLQLSTGIEPGISYSWQWPGGNVPGAELLFDPFLETSEGYYILTATDTTEGCTAYDSVYVQAIPLPVVLLTVPPLICEGDTIVITSQLLSGGNNIQYSWTAPVPFEQGDTSITIAPAVVDNNGTYTLVVTEGNCTSLPATVTVLVNQIDTLALVADTVFCAGSALSFSVPDIYQAYSWNTGATTPLIVMDTAGTYTVTVTAANGCKDTDTINVAEVACTFDNVANVFTPNGDGMNDSFIIKVEGAENITVLIYNRWGRLIRQLSGQAVEWDGTTNSGEEVTDGVYYYIGDAKLVNGKNISVAGYVQVLK